MKLVAATNVQTVSSPDLHVSDLETIPSQSKENQLAKNAAPDLDLLVISIFYYTFISSKLHI